MAFKLYICTERTQSLYTPNTDQAETARQTINDSNVLSSSESTHQRHELSRKETHLLNPLRNIRKFEGTLK